MNPGSHVLAVVGILVAHDFLVSIDPKRREVNVIGKDILRVTWEWIDMMATARAEVCAASPFTLDAHQIVYAPIVEILELRAAGR